MNYAEYVRALRNKRGLTQKQLAEAVGVATGTIQQYELGKRQPRDSILERIAEVCDAPKPSLIFGKPDTFETPEDFKKAWNEAVQQSRQADEEEQERLQQLTADFHKLNVHGQKEAVKRTSEMTRLPEFTEGRRMDIVVAHGADGKTTITDRKTDEKFVIDEEQDET